MTISLLTLALHLLPAQQDPQAPPQRSLETFSLRPFVAADHEPQLPPFGTLLPSLHEAEVYEVDLLGWPPGSQFEEDHVRHLFELLHGEALEDGRLELAVHGDRLSVDTDPERLAAVRAQLRALRTAMGRPIEIEARLYAAGDGPLPAPVLDAAAARDLAAGHRLLWRSSATTRSNRRAVFDALRWSRYVRDVNVEVAQNSKLANPVLGSWAEGLRIACTVHSLAGSEDLVLCVQFAAGQRREVQTVSPGGTHPGIDLPRLATAFGACGARLPQASALVVALDGHRDAGDRFLLVLSPRHPTPRPDERIGDLSVLPVSALTHRALLHEWALPEARPQLHENQAELQIEEDESRQCGRIDADELLELMHRCAGDEDELARVTLGGGFAFVRSERAGAAVAELLQGLQERLVRTVALRCSVAAEETATADPLAPPAEGGAASVRHDVALPCLAGRNAMLFRGLEANVVRTQVPEIAQDAGILKPVIENLQDGLWLRVCPTIDEGAIDCDLAVQVTQQSPAVTRQLVPGGMMMLTDTTAARFVRQLRCQGQPVELGRGSTFAHGGRHWRPVVTFDCR